MKTERLAPDEKGITAAAEVLRKGGLLALPTETVYGLGADARNDRAVARIYEAKGRPSFNPLIVHVPDLAAAEALVTFDDAARALAEAFWPGALTLVLPLKSDAGISKLVTAGLETLAVRVPDGALTQEVLRSFGGPVAAPSANPSGRISPTTAQHVLAGLDGRIDAVLDGGACPVGVESTIVTTQPPRMLRAGGVPLEVIEGAMGRPLEQDTDPARVQAPGQLASHYAPEGIVRLNASAPRDGEVMVGFGATDGTLNLSPAGDLLEAAANLFDVLHQLDAMGAERIAVAQIPDQGLGRAINDRLRRAAAPRNSA